jgi:hypothetical protein
VVPKWVIVYQADGFGELRESEVVSLTSHTTYEQIHVVVHLGASQN